MEGKELAQQMYRLRQNLIIGNLLAVPGQISDNGIMLKAFRQ